jgi:hypothetical protein
MLLLILFNSLVVDEHQTLVSSIAELVHVLVVTFMEKNAKEKF